MTSDPAPPPIVVVEVHLDEAAMDAGGGWEAAARAAWAIAEAAEGVGARLTFRVRERVAAGAARLGATNPLRLLEGRGHEIGTHAHGRRLDEAKRAVDACGVENRGVTPGMVQGDPALLLRRSADLGFAWITDAPPGRATALGGWRPWRPGAGLDPAAPALGPILLEASADPFAWGVLRREPGGIRHGAALGRDAFARLAGIAEAHARRPMPEDRPAVFLVPLHDHNLCDAGGTRPGPASLDALLGFLAGRRVVTAGEAAATEPHPRLLARDVPRGPALARALALEARPILRRVSRRLPLGRAPGTLPVRRDGIALHATWTGPDRPRGVLLLSHAGLRGGTSTFLDPFGIDPRALVAAGLAVVAWDRAGTGRSPAREPPTPGNPAHVRDFEAVWDVVSARAPGVPIGVLSWSAGILPALGARRPLAFLLDGEAPADRWTLRPPDGAATPHDPVLDALPLEDDDAWAGREPRTLLPRLTCPYHRFQAEIDHVHGRTDLHARLLVEAARKGAASGVACNGRSDILPLPGRLHAHGPSIARWILEAFAGEL